MCCRRFRILLFHQVASSARILLFQPPPLVCDDVVVDDVFVVCVHDGPGVDICGGKIGNCKARFCIAPCEKGLDTCRYSSHLVKADIAFPAYYIRALKSYRVFRAIFGFNSSN